MKKYIEQNRISYELRGEQYYPLLELPEQKEIGKYGRMHLDYLKEHRKGRYTNLLSEGTLNQRLYEIDVEAKQMVEGIITHLADERGIDENSKSLQINSLRSERGEGCFNVKNEKIIGKH